MDVAGKRVTVMGLGRHGGGIAAVRYLASQGAIVTVSDQADAKSLAGAVAALDGVRVARYSLGGHRAEDFAAAELLVVNPAVRPGNRYLAMVDAAGAATTTEIELFLRACPAAVIGVTGSVGKSSTAAMLAAIFAANGRRTWLGGNIGRSLLDDIFSIRPHDWVVLELSSFQLARLPRTLPGFKAAVVTNCTPNHLDWHGSFDNYAAAKRRILDLLGPDGVAVLNAQDPEIARWGKGIRRALAEPLADGAVPPLAVAGAHQRANARCAAAAALAVGCPRESIDRGLRGFRGLPHRLMPIQEYAQRRFYDDSKATTPEATIAALSALEEPIWLLAGGSEKGCDFEALAETIAARARGAAFFGATGPRLYELVRRSSPACPASVYRTLDEALGWCWQRSAPQEAILLSPACASHDQFIDYEDRAAHFARAVSKLVSTEARGGRGTAQRRPGSKRVGQKFS